MNTTSKVFMTCAVVLLAAAIIMPSVQSDGTAGLNAITPAAGGGSFDVNAEFPPVPEADQIQVPARVDESIQDTAETLEEAATEVEGATDAWGNDLQDIEPAAGETQDTTPKALQ